MPVYKLFPIDPDGKITGVGSEYEFDSDGDARVRGESVVAKGDYVEIWRGDKKIFSRAPRV
ncbi:hypothetical protein [Lichenicoccus roseus]|uniref:Uncharacterized protein n=1 Tax=Lichenicoccus roseus TaxID=2683649 RepID=A0A5R9J1E6_9PROT|nr:hypothetical protein [Lichenicoccus roseus]TLU71475.1 hypothetical protein FE263_16380 [Lichenicoccus roseus]